MEYTMKDVTEKLGMTVHTVRHYTDMGLVPSLKHDKNGNRIFDEEALNWLTAVRFLRCSGLSIPEIRHYFELCQQGMSTFQERYEILVSLKERTDRELQEMLIRSKCINDKVEHCKDILAGKSEDDCNPLNW